MIYDPYHFDKGFTSWKELTTQSPLSPFSLPKGESVGGFYLPGGAALSHSFRGNYMTSVQR